MFVKGLIVVVLAIFCILQTQSANLKYYPKSIQDEILKCRAKFNVTEQMIDTLTVPKESICFFNCAGVAAGYVGADGNPSVEEFVEKYSEVIPELHVVLLKECKRKATGKDACEKAYNLRKCMLAKAMSQ